MLKQKDYNDRIARANDISLNQFGKVNEVLLAIAIAFIGFLFTNKEYKSIIDNNKILSRFCDINFTLLIICMLSVSFSIVTGLLLIINRLHDYRITRRVILIRKWYFEFKNDKKNNDSSDIKIGLLPRQVNSKTYLILALYYPVKFVFCNYTQEYFLSHDDIKTKNDKEIIGTFEKLLQLLSQISQGSWRLLNVQIGTLILAFISYIIFYFR